jgi:hypothetical protein
MVRFVRLRGGMWAVTLNADGFCSGADLRAIERILHPHQCFHIDAESLLKPESHIA